MRFFLLYDPIISYICRSLYYRRRVDDEAIGSDERISVLGEAFRHEDVMGGGGGVYDGCKLWRCFVLSMGRVVGMNGEQLENRFPRTGLMLRMFSGI